MEDSANESPLQVTKHNGAILLDAMKNMSEPTTTATLSKFVADQLDLPDTSEVTPVVRRFLRAGTTHGFLERQGQTYVPSESFTTAARRRGGRRKAPRGGRASSGSSGSRSRSPSRKRKRSASGARRRKRSPAK